MGLRLHTTVTFLLFAGWAAIELRHGKWDTILAAVLWGSIAFSMGVTPEGKA